MKSIYLRNDVLNIGIMLCLSFLLCACSDDKTMNTECGMVYEGELKNGLKTKYGKSGHITAVNGRGFLAVDLDGDEANVTVALHGLKNDISPAKAAQAQAILDSLFRSGKVEGYFVPAQDDCHIPIVSNADFGGIATPGQFIIDRNTSLSEVLLASDVAEIETRSNCNSQLLKSCYQSLLFTAGNIPTPTPTPTSTPRPTPFPVPTLFAG